MKKKLLHVKGWLRVSNMGVDLLVDTGFACDLMSTTLCKKLGVVVDSQVQILVEVNGDKINSVGVTTVQTQMGEWCQDLYFRVVMEKVQPILGYPSLKKLQLTIGCEQDFLISRDGRKVLCHAMVVPNVKKESACEKMEIMVT